MTFLRSYKNIEMIREWKKISLIMGYWIISLLLGLLNLCIVLSESLWKFLDEGDYCNTDLGQTGLIPAMLNSIFFKNFKYFVLKLNI